MPSHTKAEQEKNKPKESALDKVRKIINFFTGGGPFQAANEKIKKGGRNAANAAVRAKFKR